MADEKPHFLPPLAFYYLDRACAVINEALDGYGCYLVGSCGERRDFRDVDVRYVMRDEAFDAMFSGERRNPFWSLLSVAISSWLSDQCGFSVDFQIQSQAHANSGQHEGRRNPLGVRVEYPGELPRYQEAKREQRAESGVICRACQIRRGAVDDSGYCITCRAIQGSVKPE